MKEQQSRFGGLGSAFGAALGGFLLILVTIAAAVYAQSGGTQHVDQVVATLKLAPGQKVADIGAGAGRYSRPLAKAVAPAGVVYAVDIDKGALERNEKAAADAGVMNLKWVLAPEDDPKIPEQVDLVFFSDSLHHISGQEKYLRNLRKYVKPGGRIAVIDFSEKWPQSHHIRKYTTAELDGWMKDAGFTRAESHDFVTNHFFVIYR